MKKRLTCTIKFKTDHQALNVCKCFTKPTKLSLCGAKMPGYESFYKNSEIYFDKHMSINANTKILKYQYLLLIKMHSQTHIMVNMGLKLLK